MTSSSARGLAAACILAAVVLGGCVPPRPKTTLTRRQVIEQFNANAAAVPRLWARARIHLSINHKGRRMSWGSTSSLAAPNGLLLMGKGASPLGPHDFVLIGRAAGATELFRLGNSSQEGIYYMWYSFGDRAEARWGRDELAGAPGVDMPIDPMAVLSMLAVTELPDDFTRLPTCVMTLAEKPYAYVLTYVARQPVTGEILFRREVCCTWSDDKPPRPYQVSLFDAAGERVMTARLKGYREIDVPGAKEGAARPVMPTDIQISWPAEKSSLHIALGEMTTADKWDRRQVLFAPNIPPGIPLEDVVQVDADVSSGGAAR